MPVSTSVLVPLAVLQGETLSEAAAELLLSVDIVLVGYHDVPDQTATEQARDAYGPRLRRRLDEHASLFDECGVLEKRTVFTHNPQQTIERIAIEQGSTAVLLPNPAPTIQRVLVPIRGSANLDQLLSTTAEIAAETDCEIRLYHAARPNADAAEGQELLSTAATQLEAAASESNPITTQLEVTRTPLRAITSAADDAEFVIIGERKPSVVDHIFGDVADRLAAATAGPVLVVRKLCSEPENK